MAVAQRPNLKTEVANYVRSLIFSGQLRPGEKVQQDEIAEVFGISRLPVREALILLESEGLIDNKARRGSFVAPFEPEDVRHHYVIFGLVSGLAARTAAERLSDQQILDLRELVASMADARDSEVQSGLNKEFHSIINRAAGSRRLRSVLSLLSKQIPEEFFQFTEGWSEQAQRDHEEIVDRLAQRDPAGAGAAMELHLQNSGEYAVRALHRAGVWGGS